MRISGLLIVAACVLTGVRTFGEPAATRPAVEASPHAEALRLVFEQCADRIAAVETEHWWFDTKSREWTATRPCAPGIIDSTHLFLVRYRIDGKLAASWMVDTRARTVKESTGAATQPSP